MMVDVSAFASVTCPLCATPQDLIWLQDLKRCYYRCEHCALIFADPASHLSADEEKAIYQQHQNNPADAGYRKFLNKLAAPLLAKIGDCTGLSALDFGSGPGPTLHLMLAEAGLTTSIYDPYFADDKTKLSQQYDVICSTEAIEHFYQPANEWALWLKMLKPGGTLGLMTKLAPEKAQFFSWHYKNDPTHVSFFSRETFEFLAKRDGFHLDIIEPDVILLSRKPY
jgi:SAM-dependent methyltransferase